MLMVYDCDLLCLFSSDQWYTLYIVMTYHVHLCDDLLVVMY